MNSDEKKVEITDLHFGHTEQQNFDQYADVEIAGMTEHNARVRARRAERLYQNENALTRQQLQMINESLQKQIDEQKINIEAAEKDAQKAKKTSNRQFFISTVISIVTVVVSVVSSVLIAKFF